MLSAVIAFALVTAVRPAVAEAGPLVTGLSRLDSYEPLALQQASASGIRMVHISLPWAGVAPSHQPAGWNPEDPGDPNYRWTSIDDEVKRTVEAGLTPVLAVEGAPLWAQQSCHRTMPDRLCHPHPSALAAFATAAATRYSGFFGGLPRVRFWQGLNEPNLGLFFNPQLEHGKVVSARLYRPLMNGFYFAVKSVDPTNLVIAGGLGPVAGRFTTGPMLFTRLLLCMQGRHHPRPAPGNCGGGVHFDIFDIHPYTSGGPRHAGGPDDVELGSLGRLGELLRAADRAGRIKGRFRHTPLWVTEFSWDSKPPDPGGLPMWIETRWTAEALHQAWLAGVSNFFWFTLRDLPRNGLLPNENFESGLYFRGTTLAEDRPKQAMYAFRFPFVAYSSRTGFSYWGRTPTSAAGNVAIEVRNGGGWRTVSVAHANPSGIFRGAVRASYGRNRRGAVRASFEGESAPAFSLRPVREFRQRPFGNRAR